MASSTSRCGDWTYLPQYYSDVCAEILSFLHHGDCGRLFFVSSTWRRMLSGPDGRHFLLRNHFVPVDGSQPMNWCLHIQCRFPWMCCIESIALLDFFLQKRWVRLYEYGNLLVAGKWHGWFLALRHGSVLTALYLGMDTYVLNEQRGAFADRDLMFPMVHFHCLDPECAAQWFARYNQMLYPCHLLWHNFSNTSLFNNWAGMWDVVAWLCENRPELLGEEDASVEAKRVLGILNRLEKDCRSKHEYTRFCTYMRTRYRLVVNRALGLESNTAKQQTGPNRGPKA